MSFSEIIQNPVVVWFLAGLVLILLEFALPGVIILFFGIGAWITSLSCLLFEVDTDTQLFIFLISSIGLLIFLRKHIKQRFFNSKKGTEASLEEEFIGKTGTAQGDIQPNTTGKISFKGTTWHAVSDTAIKDKTPVEITGKESITLTVKPK